MTLTNDELTELLDRLLAGWENEVVEFKEAARQFSADKTGEYVSALSNEANLRGLASGWLVFGVSNTRQVVGTTHLSDVQQRQTLKHHIHQSIDQGLTVRKVYEVIHSGKRVVLLEVPAAPRGIPISWKGDYRARAGETLVPLSLDKLDQIRHQSISTDWTAVPLPDATLDHLDPEAVLRARQGFAERYPRLAEELTDWEDATLLSKIRLIIDGARPEATAREGHKLADPDAHRGNDPERWVPAEAAMGACLAMGEKRGKYTSRKQVCEAKTPVKRMFA